MTPLLEKLSFESTITVMSRNKTIRVFEHQRIRYGERYNGVLFNKAHWEALVHYNEEHDNRFFSPVYKGIKFSQYVGVMQVGKLTIEILPKADKPGKEDEAAKQQWHEVLFQMLRVCKYLRLENSSEADLRLRNWSLQDIYFSMFLTEVEQILHRGLMKQYRKVEGNRTALKGSFQFQQHIAQNLVHRERFYVRHQVYDQVHLLHQLLFKTLQLFPDLTLNPSLTDQAGRLLLLFPEMPDLKVTEKTFSSITYGRKNEHYRRAIDLSRMILLNYSPDLRGGANNVLAILFDMNELFEEYIYQQLRRAAPLDMRVRRQVPRYFWENRRVKPDIVVEYKDETIVLDTKWKVLRRLRPDDADLKQMYVYHRYFGASRTILLYPKVYEVDDFFGWFREPDESLGCRLAFLEVVDGEGGLNGKIGCQVLELWKH